MPAPDKTLQNCLYGIVSSDFFTEPLDFTEQQSNIKKIFLTRANQKLNLQFNYILFNTLDLIPSNYIILNYLCLGSTLMADTLLPCS